MKLRLTPQAISDLEDICDYVAGRNPSAAMRIRDAIQAALRLISTYPQAGTSRSSGLRRFVIPRYPYLIFYGFDELAKEIRVFAIRHSARREEY